LQNTCFKILSLVKHCTSTVSLLHIACGSLTVAVDNCWNKPVSLILNDSILTAVVDVCSGDETCEQGRVIFSCIADKLYGLYGWSL